MDVDRDAATVVDDAHAAVGQDRHVDVVAVAGERLVDRVVDDLVDEVVQTARTGRADVHAGSLADGFETFEHLDRRLHRSRREPCRRSRSGIRRRYRDSRTSYVPSAPDRSYGDYWQSTKNGPPVTAILRPSDAMKSCRDDHLTWSQP